MTKKVLFIEEDIALLTIYREVLIPKGIQVTGASTGKEGLTKVTEEKPDLIVLDIMLPGGISGFDVLEQLKANPLTQAIPVIVLTNLDSEENVAKKIGAQAYKIKANTTLDEIVKLITECLNSAQSV
jgi:CheY-like chemotaxis protein